MYLIQVQAVLYTVISATSYCQCSGSTPFEIAHGSLQSAMQLIRPYWKYRRNRSGTYEEARSISIPWIHSSSFCEDKITFKLHAVIPISRSPVSPCPLLCLPLWGNCECHCVLDTEWWRQSWFLPHQQDYPTSIWRTSEHRYCQCYTIQTDRVSGRLWVQHHSMRFLRWETEEEWEWAPDNHSSRYTAWWIVCVINFKTESLICLSMTSCITRLMVWYIH